jgi:glutathione peroxidase-family protein
MPLHVAARVGNASTDAHAVAYRVSTAMSAYKGKVIMIQNVASL